MAERDITPTDSLSWWRCTKASISSIKDPLKITTSQRHQQEESSNIHPFIPIPTQAQKKGQKKLWGNLNFGTEYSKNSATIEQRLRKIKILLTSHTDYRTIHKKLKN